MKNILETGARKNFIRAALVLPVLMGLVPEGSKLALQKMRIKMLKDQASSLFPKNERRAVVIMENAQREEFKLFDRRRSIRQEKFVSEHPITVKEPVFPPEPYHGPGDNLSFLDIQFMKKYYKAKMEIALKLSLKDVVQECSDILKALETAVEGGSLNYPSKGK